jgi:hypothetical protein
MTRHQPVIGFERAVCSCGNMPGIWRDFEENIGRFTLRAYAAWERHAAESPEDVRGTLFEFERVEEKIEQTADLFA